VCSHCVDVNLAKILKVHYKQYSKRNYIPSKADALLLSLIHFYNSHCTYMSCAALFSENSKQNDNLTHLPSWIFWYIFFAVSKKASSTFSPLEINTTWVRTKTAE